MSLSFMSSKKAFRSSFKMCVSNMAKLFNCNQRSPDVPCIGEVVSLSEVKMETVRPFFEMHRLKKFR